MCGARRSTRHRTPTLYTTPVRFKRFRNLKDEKSECLVHYSYVVTDHKLMLLDIQGSESTLYDPEIATEEIMDADGKEVYFCCGNCSTLAIEAFLSDHKMQ